MPKNLTTKNLNGLYLTKDDSRIGEKVTTTLSVDAVTKELDSEKEPGYIAGWASASSIDHYGHIVEHGAFTESIMTKGLEGPKGIKLLLNHDWRQVAGVIKVLEYREGKLWIEAQMNLGITYVKDCYEAAKMLGGMNFSVGFYIQDYEFKEIDKRDILYIKKGELFEVSVVPFPGNDDCEMKVIKNTEQHKSLSDFEKALVAQGLAKNRNDAQAIVKMVKTSSALFLQNKETPVVPPEDTNKALAANVTKLQMAINGLSQTLKR